jgi:alpha-D-xyloside xylohydrolase
MKNPAVGDSSSSNFIVGVSKRWNLISLACTCVLMLLGLSVVARGAPPDGDNKYVLERENRTIVLEPYGASVIRITLRTDRSAALATPGYGVTGTPSNSTWPRAQESGGYEVIRSGRLLVRIH